MTDVEMRAHTLALQFTKHKFETHKTLVLTPESYSNTYKDAYKRILVELTQKS